VTLGTAWFAGFRLPSQPTSARAATVVVQPESRVLPDGTVVELNRGTDLAVEFAAGDVGSRRVVLVRGEAHFQVAKDPARPFVVVAGGVAVRAVGTAFSVQLGSEAVAVLVTEGRVAVAVVPAPDAPGEPPASSLPAPLAMVDAGQQVSVELTPNPATIAPSVRPVSDTERDVRLAWRAPRVEFTGARLDDVIPIFNRFGSTRLELADPKLGDLLVSGLLRADNNASLVRLLENEFGLATERRGEVIVVRRR
jgi:transmembrane sensor